MVAASGRPYAPLSLKHPKSSDFNLDDEPNTPSKSKMLPRKPWAVYAVLLLLAFITGFLLLQRDATGSRTNAYRKVLVDKMHSFKDADGSDTAQSVPHLTRSSSIENSEARQREALEIADKILHLPHSGQKQQQQQQQQQLGELSAGGGSVAFQPVIIDKPNLETNSDENQEGTPAADSQDGTHAPVDQDATAMAPADAAAAIEQPSTVTVSQVFTNGEQRDLVVDAARIAFLEVMSNGLESEDVEIPGPIHQMWWSNIVSTDGKMADTVSRPSVGHTAALAASLTADTGAPVGREEEQCKIHVLDVGSNLGPSLGARPCDLSFKRVWPFSRHKYGIDGVDTLQPEHYQYAAEHWISESIRNSSRYVSSMEEADFVFIDMWCYHTAWLAYIHPLGNRNTTNPEPYIRRTLNAIVKMDKFTESKGGSFALVHPNPIMKGLFSEEAMCEDLASVFNMVPEHSSLCVWTQDSSNQGKSIILPYVASLDLDFDTDLLNRQRDELLFFRGGCGHPDPSIRGLFAAGKMLRYGLVNALTDLGQTDIDVECSCDICDNHMPHPELQEKYRDTKFCPVLPSNVQSSRRLSEVILNGCIPVFIGPPFHTLPLANEVDYASMGIFLNISESSWINDTSSNYLQNHMVMRVWRLDDPAVEKEIVNVENVAAAVNYLRTLPEEVVTAKRKSVLDQRFKFYYGAKPESAGGDGKTSVLGELLMKQMCRRAALVKRRLNKAKEQGLDLVESDVQIRHASLLHGDQKSLWSSIFRT